MCIKVYVGTAGQEVHAAGSTCRVHYVALWANADVVEVAALACIWSGASMCACSMPTQNCPSSIPLQILHHAACAEPASNNAEDEGASALQVCSCHSTLHTAPSHTRALFFACIFMHKSGLVACCSASCFPGTVLKLS